MVTMGEAVRQRQYLTVSERFLLLLPTTAQRSPIHSGTRPMLRKELLFRSGPTLTSQWVCLPSDETLAPTFKAKALPNATYNDTVAMTIGREFELERTPVLFSFSFDQGIPRYSRSQSPPSPR